jgi:hypothetical protein
MMVAEQPKWHRSSFCQADGCVEVARAGAEVLVRDSKLGDASPVLAFTEAEWEAFRNGVAADEF